MERRECPLCAISGNRHGFQRHEIWDTFPFANGGNDYYALYVEDPDRIKVEFVAT